MPAHLGLKEKLEIAGNFLIFNISQHPLAKRERENRVARKELDLREQRLWTGVNNRKEYVPIKYIRRRYELRREQRELEYEEYSDFRHSLDGYSPEHRGCSETEWQLYLHRGSAFDQSCEEAFAKHFDTGFKMMLITHKSTRNKLKRIEAIFGSGKVEILWTDAS